MYNLIIASAKQTQMSLWSDVLTPEYSVSFTDNIDTFFSTKRSPDNNFLLVVDASLITEACPLPLLCTIARKVIVVGDNITPHQQIQFIYGGASGYSDKLIDKQLILRTVRTVLNNEIWLKRQLMPQLIEGHTAKRSIVNKQEPFNYDICNSISILTEREIEIAKHVYNGEDNISIAEKLNITIRTVKAHLSSIFKKLNIDGRFKLVVYLKNLQFGQFASAENLF